MKNEEGNATCICCSKQYNPAENYNEIKDSGEYICNKCWDECQYEYNRNKYWDEDQISIKK